MQQLELFPEFQPKPSSTTPKLTMSSEALCCWKQRILEHQQSESAPQAQQGTLFELAPNPCDSNNIDPYALELHNISFCDGPDWGDRIYKWRSPFNKECWPWWRQPFGK